MHDINPDTQVLIFPHLTKHNADLLMHADVVLECTDSMKTRHLIDTYAAANSKRVVYAMAAGTSGYVYAYDPQRSRRLIGIFPQQKGEDCDTVGILPTQMHLVTAVQLNICLKMLLRQGHSLGLFHIDGWNAKITEITLK